MAISVLIVDNDEITGDLLRRLIAYRLPNIILHVTAVFGNALELCRSFEVDIVITTTSMPPNSSDDMLRAIRAIPYDPVKIIIMTTTGEHGRYEPMYNAPNTTIISKPIDMDNLISLTKATIAEIEAMRLSKPAK